MKKYVITEDVIIKDIGTNKDDRFSIVNDVPKFIPDGLNYHMFIKGYIYKGADRVEIGQYLINNDIAKLIED